MNLKGKRVLVVGMAQTGLSVARFAHSRGAEVTITDGKPADALAERVASLGGIATLELGYHDQATFDTADVVVMSPGVPELKETTQARAKGVEVIAEIELAYRCFHPGATLIAITGTNGKSTTTALCGAICQASGRPTFVGGNLGNQPLIEAVDHPANVDGGLIVAEVAGFMLETCTSFRPKVAACLNITEDHLDRYGTMDVYAGMKTRIYQWLEASDVAIGNADDERTRAAATACPARTLMFGLTSAPSPGAHWDREAGEIVLSDVADGEERYPVSDLPLVGSHNIANAMAAYLAARSAGVEPDALRRGAQTFRPEPHRLENVTVRNGVTYYDDSKGTNVAAVAASLRDFPAHVVLIAGGVDKGGAYDDMLEALAPRARGLVLIGEAASLIEEAAARSGATYPVERAANMEEAVAKASALALEGDAVVLSPACSSYDMFKNYIERGLAFQEAVRGLK